MMGLITPGMPRGCGAVFTDDRLHLRCITVCTLLRASSSCFCGMFVQVRCIMVSTQTCSVRMLIQYGNSSQCIL
jgi:hypothetical protein